MMEFKNLKIHFAISVLALVIILSVGVAVFACSKTSSFGQLKYTYLSDDPSIINKGPSNKKEIALTFDADMTPHMERDLKSGKVKSFYISNIIKVLELDKVPATIFMTGLWTEMYPKAARNIAQNPMFEIGNHSYDHAAFETPCYRLHQATDKKLEITKAQDIIKTVTGKTPQYFRFPGGCASKDDISLVKSFGLQSVGWNVISGDSYLKSNASIARYIINNSRNGSIIIMHISGVKYVRDTSMVLDSAIRQLKAKGFAFDDISQLLKAN